MEKENPNMIDFNVLKCMDGFYSTLKPEHMESPLTKYCTQIFYRSDSFCEIASGPYGFGVVNKSGGLGIVLHTEPQMLADNLLLPDSVEGYMINVTGFNKKDNSVLSLDKVKVYMKNNDTSPVEKRIAEIIADFSQPQWFTTEDCQKTFDRFLYLDMNYDENKIKPEDQESGMGMNMT